MALQRLPRARTLSGPSLAVRPVLTKTASYTVRAQDNGAIFIAGAADVVFTLPATRAGLSYTFITSTLSTVTGHSLSLAPDDKIMGSGLTAADNKDLINTAATDAVGDMVTLAGDGADGWYVVGITGTWAREE